VRLKKQAIGNKQRTVNDAEKNSGLKTAGPEGREVCIPAEQARSQEELLLKSRRLEQLAEVAREISSGLDLAVLLPKVVKNAVMLTGADAGTVALLDEERQEIRYPYHFNMPASLSELTVPADAGLAGKVMKTGKPVVLEDYPSHPAQIPAFSEAGVVTILAVPVMVGNKPLGALGLFGKTSENKFSQADMEMAMAVADQAAIAVENANLFRKTNDQLRIQRKLNKVALSITSGLELEKVLPDVARNAAKMVNGEAAMIALLDESDGSITYPYSYNLPRHLSQVTGTAESGIAGDVIRKGKPRIDNDYAASKNRRTEFVGAGVSAVASVPLMIGDRCIGAIGVMDLGKGRRFTEDDIDILTLVSRQASVAVDNARLYNEQSRSAQQLEHRVRERTDALSRMYQESERKSDELAQANRRLQELDRMKSEFLANMSHELRTPLNSIIGFSKLILDGLEGDVTPEQRQDLEIVHNNGMELLRLIDDLLDLAKIEAGRVTVDLSTISPSVLVEEVVMNMRTNAAEKGLKIEYTIPDTIEPVKMDAGKVRQILLNLVGNAIKFTEAGSITVSIEQSPAESVFSVTDTGIGISPEQIDVIFDRFHQIAPGEANAAGVGLGLTISKRFVEMHNGRIWVDSEPGKGTTFSFSIPRGEG